jgi:hypothetical protein
MTMNPDREGLVDVAEVTEVAKVTGDRLLALHAQASLIRGVEHSSVPEPPVIPGARVGSAR